MATTKIAEFGTLLVPTDFSAASEIVLEQAVNLARKGKPTIILLHVLDMSLVEFAVQHEFGSTTEIAHRMRARAQDRLTALKAQFQARAEVDTITCEGIPFLEILKKSEDFAVDAIVIGKVGTRGPIEKLLFGSTAEKVLRGSRRPVLVIPLDA
jgi:nucleotide-binding universal stress UspA family protein